MATESVLDILPVVVPANHVAEPPRGQWTYAAYTNWTSRIVAYPHAPGNTQ